MTRQAAWGVSGISILLLTIIGGAVWWELRPPRPGITHTSATNSSNPSTVTPQTDDSLSSLGVISSSGVPLGNLSDTQNSQTTPTQNKPSAASTPTTSSSSSSATLDPKQFGQYEKYKNDQTALFADIKPGTGTEATSGKKIAVNYRGWLTSGQVFDENLDTSKPYPFTLGVGEVVRGWDQAIAGMKVGGERLLIVPPAVGYSAAGRGSVPPNAIMVFYVKLIAVN